jgi:hypothetical protein
MMDVLVWFGVGVWGVGKSVRIVGKVPPNVSARQNYAHIWKTFSSWHSFIITSSNFKSMPHSKSSSNLRVQFIQHRCTQSIDEEDK